MDTKKKINDILLRVQSGQLCIDESTELLLEICGGPSQWTSDDIDLSYIMGCESIGGFRKTLTELNRLDEMELKPHHLVVTMRDS